MKVLVALLLSLFAHVAAIFSISDDISPLVFNGGQTSVVIAMNIVDVTTQQAKHKNSQPKKTLTKAVKVASPVRTNFAGDKIKAMHQKDIVTLVKDSVKDSVQKKEPADELIEPIDKTLTEEKELTELVKVPVESLEQDKKRKELSDDITQAAQLATAKHHAQQLALINEVVDVDAPSIFKAPRPKLTYPQRAKRRGYQGQALVLIELNASGEIHKLSLSQSSGYQLLDKAALKNVSQWQFNPVLQEGIAIRARFEVPIGFFLS
jgi:protein TonB